MATTVANINGLSSGIQWNDIVDQLVTLEQTRTVSPLTDQITARGNQKTAWTQFQTLVEKMNDSARALRSGGIGGFSASASVSPTTGRSIVGVSASSLAQAGNYKVEVLQTAQAAKVSGSAVASSSTALGFSGSFSVNGAAITVGATDTLDNIRTKINDANTGSTPTGVTASILSNGSGGGRLVLTRDTAGGSDITVGDSSGGIAQELGFVDSRSKAVSSTTTAIAAAMGLTVTPPPATMRVNGHTISVDLSVDSLSSIVAKIDAAGGQASVVADNNGDTPKFRIATDGNVKADPNDPNSQAVINALGFAAGQYGAVRQAVTSQQFTTGSGGAVSSSTALTDLKVGGVATNIAVGDAINVRGMRGDGTAVSIGVTVDPGETMQTLVDKINNSSDGFGSGTRTAHATLGDDGAIHLTDDTGGESRLSMNLSVAKADGTAGTFGTTSMSTVGRQRQVSTAQDAQLRVDGVLLTRSTNTITDAIGGVTLSLQNAEAGTSIDVNVARDNTAGVTAIKGFADAYNNIVNFYEQQRDPTAALYGNSTLRSTISSFTDSLRTSVSSNGTYNTLAIAGVSLNRSGTLDVNESTLKTALDSKPAEMDALFGLNGVGQAFVTSTDNATRFGTGTISSAVISIDDSVRKLQTRANDASSRLEAFRQNLVTQYTNMETALSTLKSQGSYLTSAIASLNGTG